MAATIWQIKATAIDAYYNPIGQHIQARINTIEAVAEAHNKQRAFFGLDAIPVEKFDDTHAGFKKMVNSSIFLHNWAGTIKTANNVANIIGALQLATGLARKVLLGQLARASSAMAAGNATIATQVELTSLYRAVSLTEYKQLMQSGAFQAGPNSLGGKFFAESAEHAAQWGTTMDGAGNFKVIEAQFPKSTADAFMRWEKLDGIGPARYGELEQINAARPVIKGIP
jgi:hypothetical protein